MDEFKILFVQGDSPECTAHRYKVMVVKEWNTHPDRVGEIVHWPPSKDRNIVFVIPCHPGRERSAPIWVVDAD